ncbi:MAG: hypothetical protein HQL07_00585 [Nitrospirae bacterium]|nr:hypothetical protein [Magnetococcales bacterium]
MKWLQHFSDFHREENVVAYREAAGHDGYGFMWLLFETVADRMTINSGPSVTYPTTYWAKILDCHPNRLTKFMSSLEVHGLVVTKFLGGSIRVEIPILLKMRDNYSSRYKQTTSQEVDLEAETDKNKQPPTPVVVVSEKLGKEPSQKQPETPVESANLIFPDGIGADICHALSMQLCGHKESKAQQFLDELAAAKLKKGVENPVGWMRSVIARNRQGTFTFDGGAAVAKARADKTFREDREAKERADEAAEEAARKAKSPEETALEIAERKAEIAKMIARLSMQDDAPTPRRARAVEL